MSQKELKRLAKALCVNRAAQEADRVARLRRQVAKWRKKKGAPV